MHGAMTMPMQSQLNVFLKRYESGNQGTFGKIIVNGIVIAATCEDPWNGNQHGISCIPEGIYQCAPHSGARFKNVWEVEDVPSRDAILIHAGNTIKDTRGCVLVGARRGVGLLNGLPFITDSEKTLNMLRLTLPPRFLLTVKNGFVLHSKI
jgi:Family of unknown function (DUF5675)